MPTVNGALEASSLNNAQREGLFCCSFCAAGLVFAYLGGIFSDIFFLAALLIGAFELCQLLRKWAIL